MKFRLIIVLTALLPIFLQSQDETGPMRIEIEARAEVFQMIPCGESGALVFYETINQLDQQTKLWYFAFYNNRLQSQWTKEIPVLMNFVYLDYYFDDNQLYLAFQSTVKTKPDEFNFQVISFNIFDAEPTTYNMFVPEKANLVRFTVADGKLIVGLNFWKEQALIIVKDLVSNEESVVKFIEKPSFIKDLKYNPTARQIWVALNVYMSRRESSTFLNAYDFTGQLINSVSLAPIRSSEKLMNAQIHFNSQDEIFVLGSFNNLNGKMDRSESTEKGEQSEGFYIAGIVGGSQKFLRTHRLLDFKNITQILNNEQLAAAGNVLKKQNKKGQEQSLNYDFLIHNLTIFDNEFIILAEAYYPEFRQISTMSYDFYGRPMPYYYTVFDGFKYFNAFVVSFDKEGNLNWSNGIKIWDMQSMQLSRRTAIYRDGSEMALFYNHEGKIVSKVTKGYEDVGSVENMKIATHLPGDVQLESSQGSVSHWYGDYFIASGYQVLRNNQYGGGSNRKVFYINKIIFN